MKTTNIILCLLFILLSACNGNETPKAPDTPEEQKNECEGTVDTVWDFPEYNTTSGLHMPDTMLCAMSDENLIITCLNLPCVFCYTIHNERQLGIEYCIRHFNGLHELLIRPGIPQKLMKIYAEINLTDRVIAGMVFNESWFAERVGYLELLIAQYEILEKINDCDRFFLLKESIRKVHDKSKEKQGVSYQQLSLLIAVRILDIYGDEDLQKKKEENTETINFIKDVGYLGSDGLLELCENYIAKMQGKYNEKCN